MENERIVVKQDFDVEVKVNDSSSATRRELKIHA